MKIIYALIIIGFIAIAILYSPIGSPDFYLGQTISNQSLNLNAKIVNFEPKKSTYKSTSFDSQSEITDYFPKVQTQNTNFGSLNNESTDDILRQVNNYDNTQKYEHSTSTNSKIGGIQKKQGSFSNYLKILFAFQFNRVLVGVKYFSILTF